nr:immunoglobulin light chain junction region [Macaca mulatta]MOW09183.1 immunoglobulin light chain junction region [Macaca mulatta]MOW10148.1 immunoglobulin light chain junction region [Macaca mulatta]MOW10328.1 immunoglobulin light chain junction region [Macaca mulatta]MOW11846.1 immunoglobulin light chain junction region [Macaca mulatta]
CQQYNNSPYNF